MAPATGRANPPGRVVEGSGGGGESVMGGSGENPRGGRFDLGPPGRRVGRRSLEQRGRRRFDYFPRDRAAQATLGCRQASQKAGVEKTHSDARGDNHLWMFHPRCATSGFGRPPGVWPGLKHQRRVACGARTAFLKMTGFVTPAFGSASAPASTFLGGRGISKPG